jgi:5-methylcytosine-specific restriction endonuclease McrA
VCTDLSQTADHIITVHDRPDLAMERANLRGSCFACNLKRNKYPIEAPMPSQALGFFA